MKNIFGSVNGFPAVLDIADVADDHPELPVADEGNKIGHLPGREIIEHRDLVALGKQRFHEVGADEAGAAGDQDFRISDLFHLNE